MKRFLFALALCLWSSIAFAQCNGVFSANTVCGTVAGGIPGQVPGASIISGLGGVWTNTRFAKTTTYAAVTGDCGNTLALGGSAFYTLTINAASGYNAACQIVVLNEDTTRGKTIAVNGYSSFILWPQQTAIIYNQNNVWQMSKPAHWLLPATTTFNVDPIIGNDNNDGLATSAGAPFQSCQGAINNVSNNVDLGTFNATIKLVDGTYGSCLVTSPWYGNGNVTIFGNASTPSNVIIDGAAGSFAVQAQNLGRVIVQHLKIQNAGLLLSAGLNSAWIQFSDVVFGDCISGGVQIFSSRQSYLEAMATYAIASSANCANHIQISHQGNFRAAQSNTGATLANINANLTYSQQFAFVSSGGDLTLTGYGSTPWALNAHTVTTTRFLADSNAVIQTLVGAAVFPGSAAGNALSGGVVDGPSHDVAPALTSCGTSPSAGAGANDYEGVITVGSGTTTGCTITFNSAFSTAPRCVVQLQNVAAITNFSWADNASLIAVTWTSGTGGFTIAYNCKGG